MRLTAPCYANVKGRIIKHLWKYKAKFKDKTPYMSPALIEKGVKIVDPLEKPPEEKWTPPDDPRFYVEPPITEDPNYHEDQIYMYNHNVRFLEAKKQASILTKSQIFEGMPEAVSDLIDKILVPDEIKSVQRYIMQAQRWDSTMDRLPRRFDKRKPRWNFQVQYGIPVERSASTLLTNLLRLCQTNIVQKIPASYNKRQMIFQPYIQANFNRHDAPIQIKGHNDVLVTGTDPLLPYANEDMIDQSVQVELPDMYPVLPIIDLEKHHVYTLDNHPGWQTGYPYSNAHTLFTLHTGNWTPEELHGKSLMYCFAYALTQAKNKYGENKLPKPVCVQCVNASETTFHFTFFQLNTLNFEHDDGIKNFAWFDSNNQLYTKHLSQPWLSGKQNKISQFSDYKEAAFKKLLAVMLYGVRGTENL